jgi:HPr kinase/phosphorylase
MLKYDDSSIIKKQNINVGYFFEKVKYKFNLSLLSDESGFQRSIKEQNLHRPGLALAGFVDLFSFSRVQIFGNTEMHYLAQLEDQQKINSLDRIFQFDIPCIILTNNNQPFPGFIDLANSYKVPVFITSLSTTKIVYFVGDFLDDQFAPKISVHGSFVDVYGVGILFTGKSGVGKSEVALDLIERGHRLVADDVIILTKKGEGILMGSGTDLVKHFMEIRGLGLINIEKMFGIRAIRFQKRLEVIVELEVWDEAGDYTRTGLDESTISMMDVDIPYVKLPILPGKNITVISEVISLHYLLRHYGYDAAKIFQDRLAQSIKKGKNPDIRRGVDYFEHDFE